MVWKETRLLSNKAVGGQKCCNFWNSVQFVKHLKLSHLPLASL